ncbi:hypothetical protein NJ76_02850, partial [Rhodococcus sp. IITR03]
MPFGLRVAQFLRQVGGVDVDGRRLRRDHGGLRVPFVAARFGDLLRVDPFDSGLRIPLGGIREPGVGGEDVTEIACQLGAQRVGGRTSGDQRLQFWNVAGHAEVLARRAVGVELGGPASTQRRRPLAQFHRSVRRGPHMRVRVPTSFGA